MSKKPVQSGCCHIARPEAANIESEPTVPKAQEVRFKEKMVHVPGGEFLMGTEDQEGFPFDGEGPVRKEKVAPFYMDKYTVTNAEFKKFTDETGYKTEAEHYGWSFVFYSFIPEEFSWKVQQVQQTPWWMAVESAFWYQPEGPGTTIEDRLDHPVIHISWNDAVQFCQWAGKRLPTEVEWEFAARGGLEQKRYPWGDELNPGGQHFCNIWQGTFPKVNSEEDGFIGTAPVQTYPANGYGLYQMSGNVWEWCSDWFTTTPDRKNSVRPSSPKVMRGGSYLCHHSYCNRYRVAARSSNTVDSSTGNIGFRCVSDA